MCDVPSNYTREPDCLDFIKKIPSTWDVTYPLESRIGEYVAIARKKGDVWFVGAMTNWSARTLKIKCEFLEQGDYTVDIFKDGINADLNGNDFKTEKLTLKSGEQIAVDMASGGGWTARFTPVK